MRHFVRFTGVKDDEARLVEGILTSEAIDHDNCIVDYESIKEAWPGYIKFGNIRAMHPDGNIVAVGFIADYRFDDEAKQVWITAYISDDQDWRKVKDGTYKGFSIGGDENKAKRKYVTIDGVTITRIWIERLIEASLVDRPADPEALFSVFYAYGHGGKNNTMFDDLLELAQKARNDAEKDRKPKQATLLTAVIKAVTKCGDMQMADGGSTPDHTHDPESGGVVPDATSGSDASVAADGTAMPEGSAPVDAPSWWPLVAILTFWTLSACLRA